MEFFLKMHLLGASTALIFQFLVVVIGERKFGRISGSLTDAAKRHNLILNLYGPELISGRLKKTFLLSKKLQSARRFDFRCVVQSLILGWINVLITGFALAATVNLPRPDKTDPELREYLSKLEDPYCPKEFIAEALEEFLLGLSGDASVPYRAELGYFIDQHFAYVSEVPKGKILPDAMLSTHSAHQKDTWAEVNAFGKTKKES